MVESIIRTERKRLSMTQAELAKAVGVTKQTVCDWEKGRASPMKSRIPRLASLFDKPIDYLLEQIIDQDTA